MTVCLTMLACMAARTCQDSKKKRRKRRVKAIPREEWSV